MSDKVLKLIEDVKSLTVLELSELVHALEDEFGVSAAAPVAVAAAPAAGDVYKRQDYICFNSILLCQAIAKYFDDMGNCLY